MSNIADSLSLPADYKMTDGEIDNIVYLTCKYTIGWNMRQADLHVCKRLMGDAMGPQAVHKLLEATAEYLWDHVCGEPEHFTAQQLYDHMAPAILEFFTFTPSVRNATSDEQLN